MCAQLLLHLSGAPENMRLQTVCGEWLTIPDSGEMNTYYIHGVVEVKA